MTISGTALHDELERTTQRWPVATMAKVDKFVKAAVGDAAAVQSRRVLAAAQAELANRAMRRFVELLYDETEGGANLWNVGDGGRVLIPTPWSRTRHASYGLTDHGGASYAQLLCVAPSAATHSHPVTLVRQRSVVCEPAYVRQPRGRQALVAKLWHGDAGPMAGVQRTAAPARAQVGAATWATLRAITWARRWAHGQASAGTQRG